MPYCNGFQTGGARPLGADKLRPADSTNFTFTEFPKILKALGFTELFCGCCFYFKIDKFLSWSVVVMLRLIYVFDNVLVLKHKA